MEISDKEENVGEEVEEDDDKTSVNLAHLRCSPTTHIDDHFKTRVLKPDPWNEDIHAVSEEQEVSAPGSGLVGDQTGLAHSVAVKVEKEEDKDTVDGDESADVYEEIKQENEEAVIPNEALHVKVESDAAGAQFSIDTESLIKKPNKKKKETLDTGKQSADDSGLVCPECDKVLKNRQIYIAHMKRHQDKDRYSCDMCDRTFFEDSLRRRHVAVAHTGVLPVETCNICGETFIEKRKLIRHKKVHTGEIPFKCDDCGKGYSQNYSLKRHKKLNLCVKESDKLKGHEWLNPIQCDFCPKVFHDRNRLRTHLRTHTNEKPYQCTKCPKVFNYESSLKRHVLRHEGVKPFECNICNKSFTENQRLMLHMIIHSGERPEVCEICNKTFKTKGGLRSHVRRHTGEKPNQCAVCGKTFLQKRELEDHAWKHTGRKPHHCDGCGKDFTNRINMLKHQRIVCRKKTVKSGKRSKTLKSHSTKAETTKKKSEG